VLRDRRTRRASAAGVTCGIASIWRGDMLTEVTFDEIKKLYYVAPFRPFEIVLTNGRQVRVDHPEFMAPSPDEDRVVVYEPDGHLTIDVPLVIAVQELKNGARSRKR
jgi:hypothetical protein